MTLPEFDRWFSDITTRFPSLRGWLAKLCAKSIENPNPVSQKDLLRTWADVLSAIALADALEVNRQMQTGDLPWVGDFDRDIEKLPQHVRRLARQLAYENRSDRPQDDEPYKPSHFPAGKIYRRILELTAKGITGEEAKAMVLAELPVGTPKWEPRYSCRICFDVGMVTVASRSAIESMLDDTFERCHHRLAAMMCSCRGHLAANPKRPRCVYDPLLDFKVEDFCWRPSEVDRFREWCEAKRTEFWESKRETAFDQFNQREFA